ncbi:phosphoribosyltransferase [Nocardioides sp.]|uniref:phosphoribosyltransferase n=1 Tax=Nocardioides sp. TaxID=35761 RepID=UPI003D14BBFF
MTSYVGERAGITVADAGLLPGLALEDLFDLALRINPRRAHLLVSTVLAKHVPTDPRIVRGGGLLLGLQVADLLGAAHRSDLPAALGAVLRGGGDLQAFADQVAGAVADRDDLGDGLVFGYAETATALGHLVAHALRWPSIHSTRRRVPGFAPALGFDEAHSHATEHLVLPSDPALLRTSCPVVLVDDELSTGRTALNTIRALHRLVPRERYVIAALIDVRTEADRQALAAVAAELGTRIDVVALASGEVLVPEEAAARVADLVSLPLTGVAGPRSGTDRTEHREWPWRVLETGRHGFTPADDDAIAEAARGVADDLGARLGDEVLVLGTEELMYAPLAISEALLGPGRRVRFSTTTRSPVRVLEVAGYPIRSGIGFEAHDNQADAGPRFAYNLAVASWSDLVLVVDSPMCTAGLDDLLSALAPYAAQVHVVVLPSAAGLPEGLTGPRFGSYAAHEVTWLLQDLSHVRLEAATEVRERAIQAGEAHYAESLPVEYRPEASYQRLFHEQLDDVAARVATAVGAVTELAMLTRRRSDLVLVSLARAGTPIGVLMQRWARHRHGLDWPHYAISIVRERGIDVTAMRYLAARHDPRRVLFVDGWTGKGAITREFTEAVAAVNAELRLGARGFDSELAVLADPGECVSLFGTRDDFLIPSACLNSTVSGLVSRTVLNADLIGPGEFHGAKFYAELAEEDVSGLYLDRVTGEFDAVAGAVDRRLAELSAADRAPTWVGWQAADRLRTTYDLPSVNLVKPGVGETTRVLLRRVPWKVLVNPERRADLRHVELLAADRGVPVIEEPGLPYSCIGLIRPSEKDGS